MQRAQELFDLFRDPNTDNVQLGGAALSKSEGFVLADAHGALSATPGDAKIDSGQVFALQATHARLGRRNAAVVVLSYKIWTDATRWAAADPVVVDTGRIALMSQEAARTLRGWCDGARWLASRDGPDGVCLAEVDEFTSAVVVVCSTGVGDGRYPVFVGKKPRSRSAGVVIVDCGLVGAEGWTTARR